jgi:hypothetical protein
VTAERDYPHGMPEREYEAAPVDVSLRAALELLELLYGTPTRLGLAAAPPGACHDRCGRTGPRFVFGDFHVCQECARLRLRAQAAVVAGEAA